MEKNEHRVLLGKLKEPFPAIDLEWKIQTCGTKTDGTPWARVVAYVTARAIMERLEDTVGPFHWTTSYREVKLENGSTYAGVECALSVRVENEWLTRRDICEPTDVEPLKGAYSGALKRAAVQFGIGRYLYLLEDGFATISDKGQFRGKTKDGTVFRWDPPALPVWAQPGPRRQEPAAPAQTPQAPASNVQPVQPKAPAASAPVAPVATRPPAAPAAPAQTAFVDSDWREVIVPAFIKSHAGKRLGDMSEKDLIWWAKNYEPKPFRGAINPKDVLFKKALERGYASLGLSTSPECAQEDAPSDPSAPQPVPVGAGASAEIDDDIPF